ncbi:MAG: fumarylacetoacetate hydrolase family protein [Gammaproteobacteria bacterium]|nr:fumarylacetoacetate hydrolase family protein [Gammaproteobacteria bacterium]
MSYVIPAPEQPSLPVTSSDQMFPVHRIYCVGRNYADHAREMGHNPDQEPPFFFLKPADVLVGPNEDFPYPGLSRDVHHEVELVVALARGGGDIPEASALEHIYGYAVGIDMTRRDLQNEAKKLGRPWDSGKAFDFSAPCSAIKPASAMGHPNNGRIQLKIDAEIRQESDLDHMIWKVPQIIAKLSALFTLRPGDLIFTGTPAGVGPVNPGEHIQAEIAGVGELALFCR